MKFFITMPILAAILFVSNNLFSQVTIGSIESPALGALLDLKEKSDGTSTRGLGMPRVALTTPNALTDILTDPSPMDTKLHIGLLVYNTTTSVHFCPGLYTWNGDEWEAISDSLVIPDISMTDEDGNVYNAKWYGTTCKGAYWMTSNLYTTTNRDGQAFTSALSLNPAKVMSTDFRKVNSRSDLESSNNPLIEYKINGVPVQDTYLTFVKKFGLLYNWEQAKVACPRGWHLATADDWNILAEMLYAVPDENNNYLSIGRQLKADNLFYKDISFGGYDTQEYNYGNCDWGGDNKWGFLSYPSGCVNILSNGQEGSSNFGIHAYWWTSDTGSGSSLVIDQGLHFSSNALYRGENNPSYFFNVRCVKDK